MSPSRHRSSVFLWPRWLRLIASVSRAAPPHCIYLIFFTLGAPVQDALILYRVLALAAILTDRLESKGNHRMCSQVQNGRIRRNIGAIVRGFKEEESWNRRQRQWKRSFVFFHNIKDMLADVFQLAKGKAKIKRKKERTRRPQSGVRRRLLAAGLE